MATRDLGRSIKGSEECFDFNCSKCKKKSVRNAEYYCPECKAYFCKSCLGDDKCTHDVLGQDSADKWGTSMQLVSFDTCKRHKWNEVQLYCPRQGVVCCSACNPAGRKTGATEGNEKVQEKKIQRLEKEVEHLEDEKKQIRSRLLQLQKLNKAQAEEIIAVTDDNNATQERTTQLQSLSKEQAGQIRDLTDEKTAAKVRMEQLQRQSENQTQQMEAMTEHLNRADDDITKCKEELIEGDLREGRLNNQLRKQKGITKEFQKEFGAKDYELKELQGEYRALKERFGKMAGEIKKHTNPDTINLGDQNRSTKIAERYSTLYNEDWIDAWVDQTEELDISAEEATENLLQVLNYCFKYCTQQAGEQFDQLSNILNNPVQSLDIAKQMRQEASASKDTSDTTLRELRKEISLRATEQVKIAFWEHMKKEEHCEKWRDGSQAYILLCAEICWAMVLNLPPLYMEFDVKPGTEVNTNLYTKRSSGKVFKQLVWPALFNGKGGGLLAKGVVEASKTISKK